MKTIKIDLREVELATLSGPTRRWLITGEGGVIHGLVHPIDGDLFTISSTPDDRHHGNVH